MRRREIHRALVSLALAAALLPSPAGAFPYRGWPCAACWGALGFNRPVEPPPGPPPIREWSQPNDPVLNALYILPYSLSTAVHGAIEDGSLALFAWTLAQEPDPEARLRLLAWVAPQYLF